MQRQMLVLLLALGGCARTDGLAPRETSPRPAQTTYLPAGSFQPASLPAPPAAGSDAQKADEVAVLEWQGRRTEGDCARADGAFYVLPSHIWGERSPFPQPLPDEVRAFFDGLDSEIGNVTRDLKKSFGRPRPELASPCPGSRTTKGGYSYPSTHAAISRLFALVLADLVPERRAEFLERADQIAHDRLVIGVHFPTDLEAGKLLADRFHAALERSAAYQRDLVRVRAAVRGPASSARRVPFPRSQIAGRAESDRVGEGLGDGSSVGAARGERLGKGLLELFGGKALDALLHAVVPTKEVPPEGRELGPSSLAAASVPSNDRVAEPALDTLQHAKGLGVGEVHLLGGLADGVVLVDAREQPDQADSHEWLTALVLEHHLDVDNHCSTLGAKPWSLAGGAGFDPRNSKLHFETRPRLPGGLQSLARRAGLARGLSG